MAANPFGKGRLHPSCLGQLAGCCSRWNDSMGFLKASTQTWGTYRLDLLAVVAAVHHEGRSQPAHPNLTTIGDRRARQKGLQ